MEHKTETMVHEKTTSYVTPSDVKELSPLVHKKLANTARVVTHLKGKLEAIVYYKEYWKSKGKAGNRTVEYFGVLQGELMENLREIEPPTQENITVLIAFVDINNGEVKTAHELVSWNIRNDHKDNEGKPDSVCMVIARTLARRTNAEEEPKLYESLKHHCREAPTEITSQPYNLHLSYWGLNESQKRDYYLILSFTENGESGISVNKHNPIWLSPGEKATIGLGAGLVTGTVIGAGALLYKTGALVYRTAKKMTKRGKRIE